MTSLHFYRFRGPQRPMRLARGLLALALLATAGAHAQPIPAAPSVDARSYVLMDYHSGEVIASKAPEMQVEPASITKLMTTLVAFSELRAGHLSLDDMVTVSEKAWRMRGSRMFIEVGTQVSVRDLLMGIIVQSGNDASVALAEHIAGSEETFVGMMNEEANRLSLNDTYFHNSTGWPSEGHLSSARDIARLSRALISEYPEYYAWYSERSFTFNDISQPNRNRLLAQDDSVDGLKTGHTEAAGYCLAASASRDGMRLISVVMGSSSVDSRASASRALLSYGFRFFETHRLFAAGDTVIAPPVWKGAAEQVAVGLTHDLYVTVPRGQYGSLVASTTVGEPVIAPVGQAQVLGQLSVAIGEQTLAERQLVALQPVPAGSFFRRAVDAVRLWFE